MDHCREAEERRQLMLSQILSAQARERRKNLTLHLLCNGEVENLFLTILVESYFFPFYFNADWSMGSLILDLFQLYVYLICFTMDFWSQFEGLKVCNQEKRADCSPQMFSSDIKSVSLRLLLLVDCVEKCGPYHQVIRAIYLANL